MSPTRRTNYVSIYIISSSRLVESLKKSKINLCGSAIRIEPLLWRRGSIQTHKIKSTEKFVILTALRNNTWRLLALIDDSFEAIDKITLICMFVCNLFSMIEVNTYFIQLCALYTYLDMKKSVSKVVSSPNYSKYIIIKKIFLVSSETVSLIELSTRAVSMLRLIVNTNTRNRQYLSSSHQRSSST